MLKLLLRLWWLQQRRNFSWKDVIVGVYIILFYVVVGVAFFLDFSENKGLALDDLPAALGIGLVIGMLIPDIILKLVMKRDFTAMDDYVKSRPIPEKAWNRFLLVANLMSFWNYILPLLMIPVFIYLLGFPQTIICFFLFLAFSLLDGVFVTCYRKATEFMLKWPLIIGWIGMFVLLLVYMIPASVLPVWMSYIGLFLFVAVVLAGLVFYLYHLKIYNENQRKVSRFHGFKRINLFSLQYIGMMRAKRIRNMVLLIVVIFFLDSLLMAFLPQMEGDTSHGQLIMYVVGDVLLPSVVLSQWTFGIEANYFQGLMTKPIRVEQLLRTCYYFYLTISGVMAILAISFVFISDEITVFSILGAYSMAIVINLTNLPTCLFSSRLEIFSNAMFNMQGANAKINLYGILFLIPLGIMAAIYYFLGEMAWCLVSVLLAMLALAIHGKVIAKLAGIYENRKYQRMEKYMEK